MYYIYMLRCMDNSLYTGITTDVERRMIEHFTKDKKCAKYTLRHTPISLESVWETENRKFASKLEYSIKKRLSKGEKEELVKNHKLADIFLDKIDESKYTYKGEFIEKWKDTKR